MGYKIQGSDQNRNKSTSNCKKSGIKIRSKHVANKNVKKIGRTHRPKNRSKTLFGSKIGQVLTEHSKSLRKNHYSVCRCPRSSKSVNRAITYRKKRKSTVFLPNPKIVIKTLCSSGKTCSNGKWEMYSNGKCIVMGECVVMGNA